MKTFQSFIMFYVLVGFLLKIVGDMKLNKYIRFYGGLMFLLILMTPVYELFSKEDVSLNIELKQMWQEYEEARNYEKLMQSYESEATGRAVSILVREMNDFLNEKGYEIKEYDVVYDQTDTMEELKLYVIRLGYIGIAAGMENTTENAVYLKNLILETYEPEFELEVYCNE